MKPPDSIQEAVDRLAFAELTERPGTLTMGPRTTAAELAHVIGPARNRADRRAAWRAQRRVQPR